MGKHGIVHGVGISDMPYGWISANEWNHRVYAVWANMILRGTTKFQERHPTYKGCTICDRWLTLSNFIEDIQKIDNYDYELFMNGELELDKDIKSNGQNKYYCLKNCMFASHEENAKQAMLTRNYDDITGENHPMYGKKRPEHSERIKGKNHPCATLADRFDKQGILIDTKYHFEYVQMGFNASSISRCCKGKLKSHKCFIFKYHEEVE